MEGLVRNGQRRPLTLRSLTALGRAHSFLEVVYMQALLDVNQSGAYLLMSVGGSAALRRHLAEMGLAIGKKLTVVQPANKATGVGYFFPRTAIGD